MALLRGFAGLSVLPPRRRVRCAAAATEAPAASTERVQRKVSLVALGCPKNVVDGEVLLGDLTRAGFTVTDDHEESDAIIINTCAFVEDAKSESLEVGLAGMDFERMGCFAFSEEDGTPAATMADQVPQRQRERRRDELISLQQRVGEEWAEGLVGQELDVLVEGYNDDGWLIGRSQWDAPDVDPLVFLTEAEDPAVPRLVVGEMRRCVVTSNSLFDLEATPLG
ncbi:Ribosomal protein S12 methylthiotransferase RimO [Tetrabaena socialis]|uniref:Ribosomal protein S12 methylthiotransferase RimO n=1 Tax=Tetrabaena socialis TaxID=47790 RepID=A0A2J8AB57_9CHLO|nr:Ribosomal protein S12 methylthiotransferase RimO [Tetrabaena socialis]|eukprot:PNH09756.1 Ribosomal protein S12 methylthiotransferase RimO [Tetrabaena socialis]